MHIAPKVAIGIGIGLAAAAATSTTAVTFRHGQANDATMGTGDDATWNRKIVGAQVMSLAAVPASLGVYALSRSLGLGAGSAGYLGMATLAAGIAGSAIGTTASMIID